MENPQYAPDHGAHGSIYRGSGGKTQDQISEKKKQERIKEDRQRLKEFIEKERRQAKAARGDSGRFQRDLLERQRQIEESSKKKRREEQRKQMEILAKVESKNLEDGRKLRAKIEEEKKEAAKKAEELRRQKEAEELRRQKEEEQRKINEDDLANAREVPEEVRARAEAIQSTEEGQERTEDDIRVANEQEKKKEEIKQEMRDLLAQNVPESRNERREYNRKLRDIIEKANEAGINNATQTPPDLEDRREKLRFLLGEKTEDTITPEKPLEPTGREGRSANAVRRRNQINIRRDKILKLQDDHPMMLAKPAAPQLHMEKLHIQTGPNMKKLDLDTTSEATEKDVELDDAECGMEHAEMSLKKMKKKLKDAYKKGKEAYKKGKDDLEKGMDKIVKSISSKESEDYLSKKIDEGNLKECDKCGELDDHFHVCAEDLSKPKCISDDIAERKLRELM